MKGSLVTFIMYQSVLQRCQSNETVVRTRVIWPECYSKKISCWPYRSTGRLLKTGTECNDRDHFFQTSVTSIKWFIETSQTITVTGQIHSCLSTNRAVPTNTQLPSLSRTHTHTHTHTHHMHSLTVLLLLFLIFFRTGQTKQKRAGNGMSDWS